MRSPVTNYELHVVLVKPIYALNVGSVSRAMSNMGAHKLHLIQPQCEITYEAQQMAANGQEGLQYRTEYKSWSDFFTQNPLGIRIALTARDGRARTVQDLKVGLKNLENLTEVKESNLVKLFLFFGPEDCGLSGEEIDQTHFSCSLPTYGPNWSLNLAQAVLMSLFIVRDSWGGQRTKLDGQQRTKDMIFESNDPNLKIQNSLPDKIIRDWIEILGFDLSKPRINAFTIIRRILLHNVPTPKELQILEAVLQQTIRKLKEYNLLRSSNQTKE